MNVEQELYRYVVSRYLQGRAPDGFDLDTHLIDSGIFDLAALLNLVCYAERVYAVKFDNSELVPEQFASIRVFARDRAKNRGAKSPADGSRGALCPTRATDSGVSLRSWHGAGAVCDAARAVEFSLRPGEYRPVRLSLFV
jgi:hypothetical protein